MPPRTNIRKEQLEIFKDFISYLISEYKDQLVENNCSESFIFKLVTKHSKDTKLNSHLKILTNVIDSFTTKLAYDIENEIIIDFIIEYFKISKKKVILSPNFLSRTLEKLIEFLQNESRYLTFFSPLHNFISDEGSLEINQSTKIRTVTEIEKQKLKKIFQGIPIIVANLDKISHILVVRIEKKDRNHQFKTEAKEKILNACNSLKVFKKGDVKIGGLFAFRFSENWNPRNKIDRIEFEPLETYSANKFLLDDSKQFKEFYKKLEKNFPHVKGRDFFDVAISRFGIASTQTNKIGAITDYVTVVESLVVPDGGSGGVTAKLSQRGATILGSSDKEILEIWRLLPILYGVRSGVVHGDTDRPLIIDGKTIPLDKATKRIEGLARSAIKKMIIYAQISDNVDKSHGSLTKQIEEMIYDRELLAKFRRITK